MLETTYLTIQTNTIVLLTIIGIDFVVAANSAILQVLSKNLCNGKKIFRVSLVNYYYETIGRLEAIVTMQFWALVRIAKAVGLKLFLIERYL